MTTNQHRADTTTIVPQGWALVWAQTHEDPETGVMTLPLTGHGFPEVASILATHPEAAALHADPDVADPAYLALLDAASAGLWSDAEAGESCPSTLARG